METETLYKLPPEIANSLRCFSCNSYLSYGPITREQNSRNFICGRCPQPHDAIPEILHEHTMQKFSFPCSFDNKGCTEMVLFNKVNDHESICSYRTVQCSTSLQTGCVELLCVKDVKDHFIKEHPHLIFNNYVDLELSKNIEASSALIVLDETTVIVNYSYDINKNVLSVRSGFINKIDVEEITCKTQMKERSKLGRSIDMSCKQCNPYKALSEDDHLIFLEKFLAVFEDLDIYVRVTVNLNKTNRNCKTATQSIIPISEYSRYNDEKEEKFIYLFSKCKELVCVYCYDIMIPPIYKDDKLEFLYCLNCAKTKNCTVVARSINMFPCKWRGCTFIGNDGNIRKHVEECEFKTEICTFCKPNLDYLITKDNIMSHLQEHGQYCRDPENIRIPLFNLENRLETKTYFTIFENKIVYFTCDLTNNYNWTFKCRPERTEYRNCFTITSTVNRKQPKCFTSYRRLSIVIKAESLAYPSQYRVITEENTNPNYNPFIQAHGLLGLSTTGHTFTNARSRAKKF
ncbi:hypothetical protein FQR65_LT03950 [Abscondita terminalis]|nr:hypothetical protein FQR65_LT03950 [Abscondita terminalis]